jgi:hypothetical protein
MVRLHLLGEDVVAAGERVERRHEVVTGWVQGECQHLIERRLTYRQRYSVGGARAVVVPDAQGAILACCQQDLALEAGLDPRDRFRVERRNQIAELADVVRLFRVVLHLQELLVLCSVYDVLALDAETGDWQFGVPIELLQALSPVLLLVSLCWQVFIQIVWLLRLTRTLVYFESARIIRNYEPIVWPFSNLLDFETGSRLRREDHLVLAASLREKDITFRRTDDDAFIDPAMCGVIR